MNEIEKRTIGLYFKVSPSEKAIIEKNMEEAQTSNQRAYLRKMAVNGYLIPVDISSLTELLFLIRKSSDNINQIARFVNETGNFYEQEVEDLQKEIQKIWKSVNQILEKVKQF